MKIKFIKIFGIGIVLLLIGTASFFLVKGKSQKTPSRIDILDAEYSYNALIRESDESIFNDKNTLYSYIKKFGPKKTTQYLNQLSAKFGSCHDIAHLAGRLSYEIYNEDSFKLCGSECHSGCYHGATEAYFSEHGTANLASNLNLLCNSELNGFFTHQCIHGIGHGLMAWANYDLPEALKSCDLLSQGQGSCWTGVFMENIVGGLAKADIDKGGDADHFTKYLNSDSNYPCNSDVVEDKYKASCYFLQTSRMTQLFGSDFNKVAQSCLKAEKYYQQSCFGSMGRDVGGVHAHDAKGAITACANAPKGIYRLECLTGAVQDSMWDPTGQDDALSFCRLLTDKEEKDACYNTIFSRAKEIFTTADQFQVFCAKAEDQYQNQCPKNI